MSSEIIDIDYFANPPGQLGARPRRIAPNGSFRFHSRTPGTLTIEFIGDSPLADGTRIVEAGRDLVAAKPGNFPFKCTLVHPDGRVLTLDPADPGSASGGELMVPPGAA